MKKVLFASALLALFGFGTTACDDDSVSVKDMCKYIVEHGSSPEQMIEIPGDLTDSAAKKAVSICVEELNNMPKCKSEYMDLLEFSYDHRNSDVTEKLMDKYEEYEEVYDSCWNGLLDNNDSTLEDYFDDYDAKYREL